MHHGIKQGLFCPEGTHEILQSCGRQVFGVGILLLPVFQLFSERVHVVCEAHFRCFSVFPALSCVTMSSCPSLSTAERATARRRRASPEPSFRRERREAHSSHQWAPSVAFLQQLLSAKVRRATARRCQFLRLPSFRQRRVVVVVQRVVCTRTRELQNSDRRGEGPSSAFFCP